MVEEYDMDINIPITPIVSPKITISYFQYYFNSRNYNINFIYNNTNNTVSYNFGYSSNDFIYIYYHHNVIEIQYYYNYSNVSFDLVSDSYIGVFTNGKSTADEITLRNNNNEYIMDFTCGNASNTNDTLVETKIMLSKNIFEINLVNVTNYQ